ncbi:hypothetical protein FHW96_002519 [Novosphingobium sp. SG751A]|uniref:NrsF family protein n=1 Tax=Novosphingobium sp. SG751A TaxID=2587000 RepID=UPI001558217E|nr:NrsF family protein [Novosphingobium sp. SG751A]NOW46359.1 hypothetical protein [Novosphingobium sp. SG751A]
MRDFETLIDELSQGAGPVRRVLPASWRALGWAPVALGVGYLATRMLHRFTPDWDGPYAVLSAANAALSIGLGLTAFASALSISVAGGRALGRGWMVLGLIAWVALAAASMSLAPHPLGYAPGVGRYCYTFVLTAGLPMVGVIILALRRTRSLRPGPSLWAAGMAIAFLSFGLLAFCHPAQMSVADFVMHLLAALTLGAVTVAVGHRAVRA